MKSGSMHIKMSRLREYQDALDVLKSRVIPHAKLKPVPFNPHNPSDTPYETSSTLITAQKTDPQLMLIYKHISLALVKNTITLKL